MNKENTETMIEVCNECGKSVALGSGLFVNRIVDFNDLEERKAMGKPFYIGDYICCECDLSLQGKNINEYSND